MKIYLVGGAVRDTLLGIEVLEKDWIVVGAKEEDLQEKGYKKIGKDFPVFLHPSSCLLYTSPSPRDRSLSRMPSSA